MKNILILICLSISSIALAYPEYAARTNMVNCSACHTSAFGGSLKTAYGKAYAARSLNLSPFSKTDLVAADFRMLGYFPTKKSQSSTSGLSIMSVSAGVNLPVQTNEDGSAMHLVGNYGFAGLATGAMETYVQFRELNNLTWQLGRFYIPFGLLSDEHRTYVRMQTNTSYRDYETGVSVSKTHGDTFHSDLVLSNGFQSGGQQANTPTQGVLLNARYLFLNVPAFLGASFSEHKSTTASPTASSLYAVLNIERLTNFFLNATFSAEVVSAKGWNEFMNRQTAFVGPTETAYQTAIAKTQSLGYYAQAMLELSPKHTLLLKYDQLTLDTDFPGDAYQRTGLGWNYRINGNALISTRYEVAKNNRLNSDTNPKANQDTFFFVFRTWL